MSLYQWGGSDPVLSAWMKAFPGVVQRTSAIPAALKPHLRYPEVLFDLQRQVLAQFHVQEAQEFYGGQNFWAVPTDPTQGKHSTISQPPYYLTLTMPGQAPNAPPAFSLTTSFTPRNKANLAAFMAVDSNPTSPDYGQIRILELPQDTAILGPQQVQSNFESDTNAAKELSLFRQGGSKVTLGNLVTQPVGGGLLYTEPVYVSASALGNAGSYPLLRRVFAYYGQNVGYAPTLQEALSQVFAGLAPPAGQGSGGTGGPGGTGGSGGPGGPQARRFRRLRHVSAETAGRAAQRAEGGAGHAELRQDTQPVAVPIALAIAGPVPRAALLRRTWRSGPGRRARCGGRGITRRAGVPARTRR